MRTNKPKEVVAVARDLARIAGMVGKDKKKLSSTEQAERERIADLALAILRQAVAGGYRPGPELTLDPGLAIPRNRPGWVEVLPR